MKKMTKKQLAAFLAWCEAGARRWDRGVCCTPSPEQAARVRAYAKRVEKEVL